MRKLLSRLFTGITALGFALSVVAMGTVPALADNGVTPVYRLYAARSGDHFYTTNSAERDQAIQRFGYQNEGISGFTFGVGGSGSGTVTPVTTPPVPVPTPTPVPVPTPTPTPVPSTGPGVSRPLVSINFDDGWKSIHDNGLPLLQKYSRTSTQYNNSTPILGGYTDYMTPQNVLDFNTQGSELAWHTRSHADLATLAIAQMDLELSIPPEFLTALGLPSSTFTDFATPYGSYNATVVTEIQKLYASHRSTDVGYNDKTNFNAYNILTQNVVASTTQAEVQGWIDQAKATNSWLVIVYHEITPSIPLYEAADPVVSSDPTQQYWTKPADLSAELAYLKNSGVAAVTMKQALTEVKTQLP